MFLVFIVHDGLWISPLFINSNNITSAFDKF